MKCNIAILILLFGLILFADDNTGDLIIGGRISYSFNKSDREFSNNGYIMDYERTTGKLYANLNLGYFVSKSLSLGLGVKSEYTYSDHKNYSDPLSFSTSKGHRSIFSVAPFLTKYFKISDKLSFSTMLELEVGIGEDEREYDEKIESDLLKLGTSLYPTVSYSLSKRWLMTISVGSIYYSWIRETLVGDDDNQNINSRFGINFDFNHVYLGFQYILLNKM